MLRKIWWSVSMSLALGAMFSLVNPSFGDDNDAANRDNSNRANNAANGQNANQNRAQDQGRAQDQNVRADNRNDNDDDATHHAALGVSLSDADGRVIVLAVMPGSPAAKAGLREGDEIRMVGDERIRSSQALTEEISQNRPGAQVELAIRRNGEKQTLKATLGTQEAAFGANDRRERTAYSYGSNAANDRQNVDRQNDAVRQRLQGLQQQVSQLQQQINSLQASLGDSRNQNNQWQNGSQQNNGQRASYNGQQANGQPVYTNGQQGYYNGQQGFYNNGQGRVLDRTGQRYSTNRGASRDHGPRETDSGNNANED